MSKTELWLFQIWIIFVEEITVCFKTIMLFKTGIMFRENATTSVFLYIIYDLYKLVYQ